MRRRKILLLLGEKAGTRENVATNPQSEFRRGNGRTGRVPQGGTEGNSFSEFIWGDDWQYGLPKANFTG